MRDNDAVSSIVPESVPLIVELGFKLRVRSFNNLLISIMLKFSKKYQCKLFSEMKQLLDTCTCRVVLAKVTSSVVSALVVTDVVAIIVSVDVVVVDVVAATSRVAFVVVFSFVDCC